MSYYVHVVFVTVNGAEIHSEAMATPPGQGEIVNIAGINYRVKARDWIFDSASFFGKVPTVCLLLARE